MSSLERGTYKHSAFAHADSIRLVELLPGPRDSPLACNIIEVRKGDDPVYEALSYAWGEPVFPNQIEEAKSQTHILITSSLWDALRSIRYEDTSRMLWIDAICINQADLKEKGHQVALMGRIFQDAQRVVVWLGRHKAAKGRVIVILEDFKDASKKWLTKWSDTRDMPTLIQTRLLTRLNSLRFFDQAWYNRVWVVQEFCLARDVQLVAADDIIPLELLHSCIESLREMCDYYAIKGSLGVHDKWLPKLVERTSQLFSYRLRRLSALSQNDASNDKELDISIASCVLELSRGRECKDERDRVYAMLALATDNLGIQPDYTLSTAQVMTNLATLSLLAGDLSILYTGGINPYHNAELSSFVPSLRGSATLPFSTHQLKFFAATNLSAEVSCKAPGMLSVGGLQVGSILCSTDISFQPEIGKSSRLFTSFESWIAANKPNFSSTYKELTLAELFTRCITLDVGQYINFETKHWRQIVRVMLEPRVIQRYPQRIQETVQLYLVSRRLFLTKQGYLGLGPYWMKPDDEVVLLYGGATPFILRKVVPEEPGLDDTWQLVGDCFLLGWMDGKYFGHTIVDQMPPQSELDADTDTSGEKFLVRTKFDLV